jgi:hypothetical protein
MAYFGYTSRVFVVPHKKKTVETTNQKRKFKEEETP